MAATPNTDRVERSIKILLWIIEKRRSRVDDVAEKLGVSRRTVFRDLATLQRAGAGIRYDEESETYRLYSIDVE